MDEIAERLRPDGLFGDRDALPVDSGLVEAEVRWTKGTQFGVQFKEKFNLKLLQLAKPAAKGPGVVKPSYLTGTDGEGK